MNFSVNFSSRIVNSVLTCPWGSHKKQNSANTRKTLVKCFIGSVLSLEQLVPIIGGIFGAQELFFKGLISKDLILICILV